MAITYIGLGDNYYDQLKARRFNAAYGFNAANPRGNHPHRLATIAMSGNSTIDRDGRVSSTGLSTTRTLSTIDYSTLPTWTRIIRSKIPLLEPQTTFGTGEFGLFHGGVESSPYYFYGPWRVFAQVKGATPTSVVAGTSTEYAYSRAVNTDPWTEDSATPTDINLTWSPTLENGGDQVSGGKGADTDSNSIAITGIPGSHFSSLVVYRLPWTATWASETAALLANFNAVIAAGGADWSGTCTASLDFT